MKKYLQIIIIAAIAVVIFPSMVSSTDNQIEKNNKQNPDYIVIAWNNLGMHFTKKYFGNFCILPPYNNQYAQIIKVGNQHNLPQVMSSGYTVSYEIPGNTHSVGKTDFWTYVYSLFGVSLPANIGLTGAGLSGFMHHAGNAFCVDGIPITPYPDNDLVNEHPYQLALIKAYDNSNNLLNSTLAVIPVSNEISCISSGCHLSETGILTAHVSVSGFNPSVLPILCADCHKDNATGKPGISGIAALSQAIHNNHSDKTNDCYKCHPGPNTQCYRDGMHNIGIACQDCHGDLEHIATSIKLGREAWLKEPDCGNTNCHGPSYASDTNQLFRNSKGHGDLYCSACHGSPHAILPTLQANDNIQNTVLQGYPGTLNKCEVCHGITPSGAGPHGLFASETEYDASPSLITRIERIYPNPASTSSTIHFMIDKESKVVLKVFNNMGQEMRLLINKSLDSGSYSVTSDISNMSPGIYFYILQSGDKLLSGKWLLVR
jgi:hypothetical protein